jgi:Flp pilus assembly pilin Flp
VKSGISLLLVNLVSNSSIPGRSAQPGSEEEPVAKFLHQLWSDERGQDVAEYAVMLAVVLVIVVGTIRLIGANANNVFSSVASSITQ